MELEILKQEYRIEIDNQKRQQREIAGHLMAQQFGKGDVTKISELRAHYINYNAGLNNGYYNHKQKRSVKNEYYEDPYMGLAKDFSPRTSMDVKRNIAQRKKTEFEVVVEEGNQKQELVVEVNSKHEALERRKAYDMMLKDDVFYHGRGKNMNATGYLEPTHF